MMSDDAKFFVGGMIAGIIIASLLFGLWWSDADHIDAAVLVDRDTVATRLSEAQQLEIIQYVQITYPEHAVYSERYPRPDPYDKSGVK